jgi:hypothetical protein
VETDDSMYAILAACAWEQFLGFVYTTGYGWCIHAISVQAGRPLYVEAILQTEEERVMVVWCVARSIMCHVIFVESFG